MLYFMCMDDVHVCMSVVHGCVCVAMCHMHAMQRTLDPLELELPIFSSHPVGDRNRTWFPQEQQVFFAEPTHQPLPCLSC